MIIEYSSRDSSYIWQAPKFKFFGVEPLIRWDSSMIILATDSMKKIVIEGITTVGKKFRPSDWAERVSGALSTFGKDRRIRYSPMLQPITAHGIKCVTIDPCMEEQYPEIYRYVMQWADANRLKIVGIDDGGGVTAAAAA